MLVIMAGLLLICLAIVAYGTWSFVAEILRVRHVRTWPTTTGLMSSLQLTIPDARGVNYYIVVEYDYQLPGTKRVGTAYVNVFRLYKHGHNEYPIAYNPRRPEQGLLADDKERKLKVNVLSNGLFIAAAGILGLLLLCYYASPTR